MYFSASETFWGSPTVEPNRLPTRFSPRNDNELAPRTCFPVVLIPQLYQNKQSTCRDHDSYARLSTFFVVPLSDIEYRILLEPHGIGSLVLQHKLSSHYIFSRPGRGDTSCTFWRGPPKTGKCFSSGEVSYCGGVSIIIHAERDASLVYARPWHFACALQALKHNILSN